MRHPLELGGGGKKKVGGDVKAKGNRYRRRVFPEETRWGQRGQQLVILVATEEEGPNKK